MHPLGVAAIVFALSMTIFLGIHDTLRDRTARDAQAVVDRAALTVENWFDRFRALPKLYARSPLIHEALDGTPEPGALVDVSRELERWNDIAGTLDTYLLRPDGLTIAASNWRDAQSFVGQNYSFRPYYTDAMEGETTGFFGLGTVSGLRGYYLSSPVMDDGRILGVVVVKVSITALEEALTQAPNAVYVTDEAGISIISDAPGLRMTAIDDIDAVARDEIARTRRYDVDAIPRAPLERAGSWGATLPLVRGASIAEAGPRPTYLSLSTSLPQERWQLHVLYNLDPLRARLWSIGAAIGAGGIAAMAVLLLLMQRRKRLIDRLVARERDKATLATRVAQRTAELTSANTRLADEVAERRAAVDRLRQTQTELVQAGKLAALGQMSAALSHEFNQPLAAIRTYTENALAFHEAGQADRAAASLGRVMNLTGKMAQLSRNLTRFARRSGQDLKSVEIGPVIDEALELLAARIDRSEARIGVTGDRDALVLGGRTRLQHVLMNLVSNAIDAAHAGQPPEIDIDIAAGEADVTITVTDRGSGIAEDVLPKIFDPFFTTKEVGDGLGLGLSICFNIIEDFGGSMRAANVPEGGARFTVTLRRAETRRVAAE
ncbi:ATP-binding protein [Palleronia sp. LCG004]|uniref:sensor histidine kinase n=1 Tax=Palleronia sp. LCG004 TaxID=3079304 RepID=UPI0029439CC3|nr:ATP-binding protein [Palleronia sp. LCG004]WOI55816.1 ATP-binding protein [Palleronia sp. LCG004]